MISDADKQKRLLELMTEYDKVSQLENSFGLTLYQAQLELFVQRHYSEQQRFALKLRYPILQRALK